MKKLRTFLLLLVLFSAAAAMADDGAFGEDSCNLRKDCPAKITWRAGGRGGGYVAVEADGVGNGTDGTDGDSDGDGDDDSDLGFLWILLNVLVGVL